jgi:hypothetical protein
VVSASSQSQLWGSNRGHLYQIQRQPPPKPLIEEVFLFYNNKIITVNKNKKDYYYIIMFFCCSMLFAFAFRLVEADRQKSIVGVRNSKK